MNAREMTISDECTVAEPTLETGIRSYFEAVAADYLVWSAEGNMHFGAWRRGVSVLNRKGLLAGMTGLVAERLQLPEDGSLAVLDAGCGLGAAGRQLGGQWPQHRFLGISIVPDQVAEANRRNVAAGIANSRCEYRNYMATGLEAGSQDRVLAIESACYSPGAGKGAFIAEMGRILRPGGVLVIADPMLRGTQLPTGLFARLLARWSGDFALPEMGQVGPTVAALKLNGFTKITVEDISWRVLPCVLHAPPLVIRHALAEWWSGRPVSGWRRRHLDGCMLSAWLGLQLHRVGYFIIRAEKETAQ